MGRGADRGACGRVDARRCIAARSRRRAEAASRLERPIGRGDPHPGADLPDAGRLRSCPPATSQRPGMDLVDLFVGSEGTLGIVVEATLRVVPMPQRCLVLAIVQVGQRGACRHRGAQARGGSKLARRRAARCVGHRVHRRAVVDEACPMRYCSRAGVPRPPANLGHCCSSRSRFPTTRTTRCSASWRRARRVRRGRRSHRRRARRRSSRDAPLRTARSRAVGHQRHRGRAAKAGIHPDIQKTAGDFIVPFDRVADSIDLYRRCFERRGLDYGIWGHLSDGNLHPNVVPRSLGDVEQRTRRDSGDGARRDRDGWRAARRARRRTKRPEAAAAAGALRRARDRARCAPSSGRSTRRGSCRPACCFRNGADASCRARLYAAPPLDGRLGCPERRRRDRRGRKSPPYGYHVTSDVKGHNSRLTAVAASPAISSQSVPAATPAA